MTEEISEKTTTTGWDDSENSL